MGFINWVDKTQLDSLRRRANARNVSFRISLRWLVYIINPVDKTQLSVHRIAAERWGKKNETHIRSFNHLFLFVVLNYIKHLMLFVLFAIVTAFKYSHRCDPSVVIGTFKKIICAPSLEVTSKLLASPMAVCCYNVDSLHLS